MDYLNWDSLGKHFYLLDTFKGIDERFASAEDKAVGILEKNRANLGSGFYVNAIDDVRSNFAPWKNLTLIEGAIPETLPQVRADKIAYLHLDMNCSNPEVAAANFFWERLVPGALMFSMTTPIAAIVPGRWQWIDSLKNEQTTFFHFLRARVC